MSMALLFFVCAITPAYFLSGASWQNVILCLLSIALAVSFLPHETSVFLFCAPILYAFGHVIVRKPATAWVVTLCVVLAGLLIIVREHTLVLRSVISFFVLNSVAFLRLVAQRKEVPPLVEGGLYLIYFPKMICGPYEQAESFLSSLRQTRSFSLLTTGRGLLLILLGIVERYVLAGNLSGIRTSIVGSMAVLSLADLFILGALFGFELFFIISAFTNWAKGVSMIFGIPLGSNFQFPFVSRSLSDFWRRWHVSVHTWMKEQVYLPLRGTSMSFFPCILATFVVSGVWHGSSLGFLVWGVVAALLTFAERRVGLAGFRGYVGIPFVFIITSALWVLFLIEDTSLPVSASIQLTGSIAAVYPKLIVVALAAFVATLLCDLHTETVEKGSLLFTSPLALIDVVLLVIALPGRVTLNSIYGF